MYMQHILGCQVMLLARAIKSLIVHATPTAHPVCAVCTGLVLPAICTHYYPSSRNSRTRTTCSRSSRITTCSRTSRTMSLSTPPLLVMPLVREPACMPPLVENLCRVLSICFFNVAQSLFQFCNFGLLLDCGLLSLSITNLGKYLFRFCF